MALQPLIKPPSDTMARSPNVEKTPQFGDMNLHRNGHQLTKKPSLWSRLNLKTALTLALVGLIVLLEMTGYRFQLEHSESPEMNVVYTDTVLARCTTFIMHKTAHIV